MTYRPHTKGQRWFSGMCRCFGWLIRCLHRESCPVRLPGNCDLLDTIVPGALAFSNASFFHRPFEFKAKRTEAVLPWTDNTSDWMKIPPDWPVRRRLAPTVCAQDKYCSEKLKIPRFHQLSATVDRSRETRALQCLSPWRFAVEWTWKIQEKWSWTKGAAWWLPAGVNRVLAWAGVQPIKSWETGSTNSGALRVMVKCLKLSQEVLCPYFSILKHSPLFMSTFFSHRSFFSLAFMFYVRRDSYHTLCLTYAPQIRLACTRLWKNMYHMIHFYIIKWIATRKSKFYFVSAQSDFNVQVLKYSYCSIDIIFKWIFRYSWLYFNRPV